MNFDVLHNFISPVTGHVLCDPDYILYGNRNGVAIPSPILIDIRLELIDLQHKIDDINIFPSNAKFIIAEPDPQLPNAQALNLLNDGFMYNNNGVISTQTSALPALPTGFLWIGNALQQAEPAITINTSNLPSLTENKIWVGNNSNRPEETDFNIAPNDAKYIIQEADANLNNAQILANLDTGILKNTSSTGVLSIALGGSVVGVDDYVTPLSLQEAIEAQALITTAEIAEAIAAQALITTAEIAEAIAAQALITTAEITAASAATLLAANTYTDQQILNLDITLSGDVNGTGSLSSPIITTFAENPVFTGTGAMTIPVGSTAQRPNNPVLGMNRINTDL